MTDTDATFHPFGDPDARREHAEFVPFGTPSLIADGPDAEYPEAAPRRAESEPDVAQFVPTE